jgi:hypothetical protein
MRLICHAAPAVTRGPAPTSPSVQLRSLKDPSGLHNYTLGRVMQLQLMSASRSAKNSSAERIPAA